MYHNMLCGQKKKYCFFGLVESRLTHDYPQNLNETYCEAYK